MVCLRAVDGIVSDLRRPNDAAGAEACLGPKLNASRRPWPMRRLLIWNCHTFGRIRGMRSFGLLLCYSVTVTGRQTDRRRTPTSLNASTLVPRA